MKPRGNPHHPIGHRHGLDETADRSDIVDDFDGFEDAGELHIAILEQVIGAVFLHVVAFEQFRDLVHQEGDELRGEPAIPAVLPCPHTAF